MQKLIVIAAILSVFTFSACNADAAKTAKAAEPTTEEQKTLYTLGVLLSQQIDTRMEVASKKAAEAGTAYVEKASKEAGATKTASGMVIKQTKEGTGAQPAATDQVKVHYEGRLIDGKVFDSSIARGEPATFPLNGVIPCWTEGVQTMKVGGKAQLTCPASLAYGPNGSPPTIPPQSTLVFDVELLDIVKPQ